MLDRLSLTHFTAVILLELLKKLHMLEEISNSITNAIISFNSDLDLHAMKTSLSVINEKAYLMHSLDNIRHCFRNDYRLNRLGGFTSPSNFDPHYFLN